jgi:hypothetical protein
MKKLNCPNRCISAQNGHKTAKITANNHENKKNDRLNFQGKMRYTEVVKFV